MKTLHLMLLKYFVSADMGAARYKCSNRLVTVKHRLRKDNAKVVSLGCWLESEIEGEVEKDLKALWFVTTEVLTEINQIPLGDALSDFLANGCRPTTNLTTYPGYEEFDKKALNGII